MSRTLFLSSAGLPKELQDSFMKLLPKKPKDIIVAFIPTAADPYKDKWFVDKVKDELLKMGVKIEDVDLKTCHLKELFGKLSFCDVIYVNGGNTFYLLDWVRKSGFDRFIEELLDTGKIYVGVSAGSIIATPSIELAGWKTIDENIVGLSDLSALNIVPFQIFPHFSEKYATLVKTESKKSKQSLVALTDKQAVLVQNNKFKIIGTGKALFFNGADKFFK